IAVSTPIPHEPNLSAPRHAKNAPASIIPSRPMFTTPLRSENMPPIAAYVSGVAQTSVDATSGPHETTMSRFDVDERVASTPSAMPMIETTTAPHARRPTPRDTPQ